MGLHRMGACGPEPLAPGALNPEPYPVEKVIWVVL